MFWEQRRELHIMMAEVDINFHFQVPYSCQETKWRETAWASCIINKCRGESLMRVGMEKRVFGLCGDINSIEETACNCFYRWIQWKPLMVTSCDLNWQLIRPVDAMWDASSLNWLAENTRWMGRHEEPMEKTSKQNSDVDELKRTFGSTPSGNAESEQTSVGR